MKYSAIFQLPFDSKVSHMTAHLHMYQQVLKAPADIRKIQYDGKRNKKEALYV
jgi:hypothetical protein